MSTRIPQPVVSQPIILDNGTMAQFFRTWVQSINNLCAPIIGQGSPEGVEEAPQYALYIDETGAPGAIQYRKILPDIGGDKKKGWVLV